MRTGTNAHASLRDAKSLAYRPGEKVNVPRTRRTVALAMLAIPLSLLFAWGFTHLMLMLVFPRPAITH